MPPPTHQSKCWLRHITPVDLYCVSSAIFTVAKNGGSFDGLLLIWVYSLQFRRTFIISGAVWFEIIDPSRHPRAAEFAFQGSTLL
jgi:hypothetical protein